MENEFKRLLKLAEDWSDFSRERMHGRHTTEYEGEDHVRVWCYFAIDSDHRNVAFSRGIYGRTVSVAFHSVPKVSIDFPLIGRELGELLDDATAFLEREKKLFAEKDAAEIQAGKERRAAFLRKELDELESPAQEGVK